MTEKIIVKQCYKLILKTHTIREITSLITLANLEIFQSKINNNYNFNKKETLINKDKIRLRNKRLNKTENSLILMIWEIYCSHVQEIWPIIVKHFNCYDKQRI